MSWNGLKLAHYVGCITQLTLMGSTNTLPNIVGRGLNMHQNFQLIILNLKWH